MSKAGFLDRPTSQHFSKALKFAEKVGIDCCDHVLGVRQEGVELGGMQLTPAEISTWEVDVTFRKLASMGVSYVGSADLLEQYCLKSHKQPMVYRATLITVKLPMENLTWTGIEKAMESLSFQQEAEGSYDHCEI